MEQIKGLVTDIQHYSVHDGPGIRTIVFLKGCLLRCRWCSNPETQQSYPELGYNSQKCILCQKCIEVCPEKCISIADTGIKLDKNICTRCFKCQEVCPTEALRRFGYFKTVEEVMEEVEQDRIFYEYSGGGLTLSGGECLVQKDFTLELLKVSKKAGINTAIETTGYTNGKDLLDISRQTDYILYDLKHVDPQKHLSMTGVSNDLILNNLRKLANLRQDIIIRIPVVPDFNNDNKSIYEFIKKMKELNLKKAHLLPLHHFGKNKYRQLNRKYGFKNLITPSESEMKEIKKIFINNGIQAIIGG